MSEWSENHMMVSSSDWTDCECKYYCMIPNGCFISMPKPFDVDIEYGDECVVVKLINENA